MPFSARQIFAVYHLHVLTYTSKFGHATIWSCILSWNRSYLTSTSSWISQRIYLRTVNIEQSEWTPAMLTPLSGNPIFGALTVLSFSRALRTPSMELLYTATVDASNPIEETKRLMLTLADDSPDSLPDKISTHKTELWRALRWLRYALLERHRTNIKHNAWHTLISPQGLRSRRFTRIEKTLDIRCQYPSIYAIRYQSVQNAGRPIRVT